jgi:hypothetical protein
VTPDTSAVDRGAVRTVCREDATWLVWEARLGPYDRRMGPHLFFESASVVRRVRTFPADWRTLSDDALMAVAEGR